MAESRYFLTVSWCGGPRGPFVNRKGVGWSSKVPHTRDDMDEILGPFSIILAPRSEPFTEDELAEYNRFYPLAEYSNVYGISVRERREQ